MCRFDTLYSNVRNTRRRKIAKIRKSDISVNLRNRKIAQGQVSRRAKDTAASPLIALTIRRVRRVRRTVVFANTARERRGALRLGSFESTSIEESKAREKSLNGLSAWPTARFPFRVLSPPYIRSLFFALVSSSRPPPVLSYISSSSPFPSMHIVIFLFHPVSFDERSARPATRKSNNLGHS